MSGAGEAHVVPQLATVCACALRIGRGRRWSEVITTPLIKQGRRPAQSDGGGGVGQGRQLCSKMVPGWLRPHTHTCLALEIGQVHLVAGNTAVRRFHAGPASEATRPLGRSKAGRVLWWAFRKGVHDCGRKAL